jgi:hypothetical protein
MLEEFNCEYSEALYGKKPISWSPKTAALEKRPFNLSHCNIGDQTSENVPRTIKHIGIFRELFIIMNSFSRSYNARSVKEMQNGANFLSVTSQESDQRRTLFLIHMFQLEC